MTILFSVLALLAAFALGVIFSQKVKDKIAGIPSDVRKQLNEAETAILAKATVAVAAQKPPA